MNQDSTISEADIINAAYTLAQKNQNKTVTVKDIQHQISGTARFSKYHPPKIHGNKIRQVILRHGFSRINPHQYQFSGTLT